MADGRRLCAAVARRLHGLAAALGCPLSPNDLRLFKASNRHQGRRCFIVGTGPSLRIADLDLIKGEFSFGCNKVYLAFDRTAWRPTYYSVIDELVASRNEQMIRGLSLSKIFPDSLRDRFGDTGNVLYYRDLPDPVEKGKASVGFSGNLVRGLHGGRTVIYAQIQVAYAMGFSEVYLLGVDFKFSVPKPTGELSPSGAIVRSSGEKNHFIQEYRAKGEPWTVPLLNQQREAFRRANAVFEESGRFLRNASRETALDVIPRVSLEAVLAGRN